MTKVNPPIKSTDRGLSYVTNAAVGLRATHDSLVGARPMSPEDEDDLEQAVGLTRQALSRCNNILHRNGRSVR